MVDCSAANTQSKQTSFEAFAKTCRWFAFSQSERKSFSESTGLKGLSTQLVYLYVVWYMLEIYPQFTN